MGGRVVLSRQVREVWDVRHSHEQSTHNFFWDVQRATKSDTGKINDNYRAVSKKRAQYNAVWTVTDDLCFGRPTGAGIVGRIFDLPFVGFKKSLRFDRFQGQSWQIIVLGEYFSKIWGTFWNAWTDCDDPSLIGWDSRILLRRYRSRRPEGEFKPLWNKKH
jgi:hypothetical protein